jgi:hypothetical protein
MGHPNYLLCHDTRLVGEVRATSHMSPRARDRYTSSTLIGGKVGAGPSSLHTTLGGPIEFANASGCKIYMDLYMSSNGSCFMVT